MINKTHSGVARAHQTLELPFFSVRNISCPEDKENNRTILTGKLPISSVLGIPTDANVRDYLLDAEGKKLRRPTQVHIAIRETLRTNPENFTVLNGGVVLVAREVQVDEANKVLKLTNPSIINGSQTQGVIKDFFNECKEAGLPIPSSHITFELLVTDDEELIAATSIARNFQNDVMTLSIVGRLKQLDELGDALSKQKPGLKLQKSETELSENYEKTERLLQVITALTPEELWLPSTNGEMPNKVFAYSGKAKCLKHFQTVFAKAKNSDAEDHRAYKELYQFYLDIIGQAHELHEKWKAHQGFKGTRLINGFRRDAQGNILEVPDGVVFPVLAALSVFAERSREGWKINPPLVFKDEDLISAVKPAFMEMADSNPQTMGKSKACYAHLYQITSLYKKLA